MPRISEFHGITALMFFGDHNPPHFHARYAGHTARVAWTGKSWLAACLAERRDWWQRGQDSTQSSSRSAWSGQSTMNHPVGLSHCHRSVAAKLLAEAEADVTAYADFPKPHWRKIASTNPLERIHKEIKRRSNVVGIFPDDQSVLGLVGAVLIEVHDDWQTTDRRYLSKDP